MGTTGNAGTITAADILELNAIGDAIFAEWYPNHRPGDPVPQLPPEHVLQEAAELASRHRLAAAHRLEQVEELPFPEPMQMLATSLLGGLNGSGGLAGIQRAMALGRL